MTQSGWIYIPTTRVSISLENTALGMKKNALSFFAFFFYSFIAWGQPFAVEANLQLQAPLTPYLSDIVSGAPSKIQVQLLLRDDDELSYSARLHFTISGQGISIRTRQDISPPPIFLDYNVPLLLSGLDLFDYFQLDQLEFQGISPQDFLQQGGRLPEGVYNICVEVLDYNRFQGAAVSNQACTVVQLSEWDPPLITSPLTDVPQQAAQNILFQWMPQHIGSFPVSYRFRLWEQRDGLSINQILQQTLPLYETQQLSNTSLLYGTDAPLLYAGQSYIVQVQAQDILGQQQFKNEGRSQHLVFTYGSEAINTLANDDDPCTIRPQSLAASALTIDGFIAHWEALPNVDHYAFSLAQDSAFLFPVLEYQDLPLIENQYRVQGLEEGTYYYRIRAIYENCESPFSTVIPVRLGQGCLPLGEGMSEYSCGTATEPINFEPGSLLEYLRVEDTIRAHDFKVVLQDVSGRGNFSGQGYVQVPYLQQTRVNVQFEGIKVDEYCRLVAGKMEVTGAGLAIISTDLAATLDSILAALDVLEAGLAEVEDILEDAADFLAELEDIEDYLANGQSVLENLLHLEEHFPYLPQEATDAIQAAIDCLKNAQNATDFEDCKAQMLAAIDQLKTAMENLYDADYRVNFGPVSPPQFGFDSIRHTAQAELYNKIPIAQTDYWVPWQSLPSQQTGQVKAWSPSQSTFPEDIQFKDGLKQEIPSMASPAVSDKTLQLLGQNHEQNQTVYALQPYQDSLGKEQVHIAGQLNLISYTPKTVKVVLVPVNGTQYPYSVEDLHQQLDHIFGQAIVDIDLSVHPNFLLPEFDNQMDSVHSGFLANYTDEMQLIRNRFKAANTITDNTYYLFLVESSQDPSKLGYMPKKKPFGFLYHQSQTTEAQYIKTIAHELAHGAFHLAHSFQDFPSLPPGETDNLMDYAQGLHLQKHQWDLIHNPAANWTLFDGDEEGAMEWDVEIAKPFINQLIGSSSIPLPEDARFFTPSGYLVSFNGPLSGPVFDLSDDDGRNPFPRGSLFGFQFKEKTYVAIFGKSSDRFLGYYDYGVYERLSNGGQTAVRISQLNNNNAVIKYVDLPSRSEGTAVIEILEDCQHKRITWEASAVAGFYFNQLCISTITIPDNARWEDVGVDPNCTFITNNCETGPNSEESILLDKESPLAQLVFNSPLQNLENVPPVSPNSNTLFDYTRYNQGIFSPSEVQDLVNEIADHQSVNGRHALMKIYLTDCSTADEQYNEAINTPLAENEWALHLHFLEYQGAAYVVPKIRLGEAIGKDPAGQDYQLAAKLFTKVNRLFLSTNLTGPSLLVMLKTLSWGMGHTAKILSNELQIQEKYWKVILDDGEINPEYDEKYARYFNQFAGTVSTLNNPIYIISTYLNWEAVDTQDQIRFALFCGMWNQLMDEGANMAQFIEMLINFMLDEQSCVQVLQALDQLKWSDIIKGLLPQFKENTANPQEAIQNAYIAGQNIMISAFFIVEAVELASGIGSLVVTLKKLKDITSATLIRAMIDIRKKLNLKGFRDPDNPNFFIVCATSMGTGIGSNLKFPAAIAPLSRWGNFSAGHLLDQVRLHPSLAQCDRSLFRLNQANGKYHIESSDINQGLPEDFELINDFELNLDNIEGLPSELNPQQLVVVKDKQNGQQWVLTRSFIDLTNKLKSTFNAPAPLVAKVARLDHADQLIDNILLRDAIKELGDNQLNFLQDLTKVDNLPNGLAPEQVIGRNIGSLTEGHVGAWGAILAQTLPDKTNKTVLEYLHEFVKYRGTTSSQLLTDADNMNPNLFDAFRSNGKINRSNLLGFSYEGHIKPKLEASPGFSIGGKSFDGKYTINGTEVWYEAKYRDFWQNTALNNINDWKSKFGSLKSIANSNGKVLEIITEGQIPQVFKDFFDIKQIRFRENYK